MLPETVVKLVDDQGQIINTTTSNNQGVYQFTIDCLTKYTLVGSKLNYKNDLKEIKSKVLDTKDSNLALTPLIVENQIELNPIYFDLDKSLIRPDAEYELENIVSVMRNHPAMKIRIESHTDSRSYNMSLSDRRAKSTKYYIVSRGIYSDRIVSTLGYGEEQFLNDCDDADASKCNEEQHQKK